MATAKRRLIFPIGAIGAQGRNILDELRQRPARFTVATLARPCDRNHAVITDYSVVESRVRGIDGVLYIGDIA